MNNGFKKLPFEKRAAVMRLKGIDLAVWLYHYWRSDKTDVASVSDPELDAALPYTRTRMTEAKRRLQTAGFFVLLGHRDAGGKFGIPNFKVTTPGDAKCKDGTLDANCESTASQNAATAKCDEYVEGVSSLRSVFASQKEEVEGKEVEGCPTVASLRAHKNFFQEDEND